MAETINAYVVQASVNGGSLLPGVLKVDIDKPGWSLTLPGTIYEDDPVDLVMWSDRRKFAGAGRVMEVNISITDSFPPYTVIEGRSPVTAEGRSIPPFG